MIRPLQLNEGIERYLETMIDLITKTVYWVVSRALFGRHQILFSFYMCAQIHMHRLTDADHFIDKIEWNCFLHGSSSQTISDADDVALSSTIGKLSILTFKIQM